MAAASLTLHEQEELAECERTIRQCIDESLQVEQAENLIACRSHVKLALARALNKIRTRKWYKDFYQSWDEYVLYRFDGKLSKRHADRLIAWVGQSDKMGPIGPIPNEYHSRLLQSVPEQLQEHVFDEATKRGGIDKVNVDKLTLECFAALPPAEQLVIAKQIEEKNAKRGQPEPKVDRSTEQLQDEAEKHCRRLRKIAGKLLKGRELTAWNRRMDINMEAIRRAE